MPKVFQGDEWKCVEVREKPIQRTRAEMQEKVNDDYLFGRTDLESWRRLTNFLSEPTNWSD